MAGKVVGRLGGHDWRRNDDLKGLRQTGYIPYTQRNNPNYQPKPMRVCARSESREALTVLSLVLGANCDYNPDSDYPFEILLPFEIVAKYMGVLHVYESGRKAYDVALNALSVLEQLDYVIVSRGQDSDTGQNKPLRLWLTERFFTSRGIQVDEIRQWLNQYRLWAIKNGLTETLKKKYERHLVRINRLGIDIERKYSLKNRLKQIKRWVVSPDLQNLKKDAEAAIEDELSKRQQSEHRLDTLLDDTSDSIKRLAGAKRRRQNGFYQAWVNWTMKSSPIQAMQLESTLKREQPALQATDPESYYRLLLERAGALPT
ncbi:Replication protein [Serratia ureilytica]|uniref:Replication protein n=1 Tax=Serratia ureilytica TaxID=300181 RepID=UPI001AA12170|nr:Replication protein [Serratia ureilytica]MBO1811416.1 Replication protein [Serratia ureilytica]